MSECRVPPRGWRCTRGAGHEGPCAAERELPTTIEPYYDDGQVTVYNADALDVIAELEIPVDAVVTDPPYASGTRTEASKSSSGAMLRAGRFADRPLDLEAEERAAGEHRVIDWRQWPNLVGALETANLRVQGMVVWDKGHFGMGNGFRSQHELVCHAAKGVPTIYDKGIGNVLKFPRQDPIDHPSPKPEGLMQRLIAAVCPPGGVVLDPFMGSGTTLRAAKNIGRRAIGIESDRAYCDVAVARLTQDSLDLGDVA